MDIRVITKIAILIAMVCASAYFAIPVPLISPITLQTMILCLAALVLTPKQTLIMVLCYILIGAIGLPVFGGGVGGLGVILSPKGGFYLGFIVAYPLMSILKGRVPSFLRYFLVGALVGVPIIYAIATVWVTFIFAIKTDGLVTSFLALAAYIPGDVLKAFAAAALGVALNKRLGSL